jgi:hypothetical protein
MNEYLINLVDGNNKIEEDDNYIEIDLNKIEEVILKYPFLLNFQFIKNILN